MKTFLALWAALIVAVAPALGQDRQGDQGFGLMLGSPTGLSWKMWMDDTVAMDAAVGAARGELDIHASFLWHNFDLTGRIDGLAGVRQEGDLPVYFGAGPRVLFRRKAEYGIRFPVGVSFLPHRNTWEFFLELAPVLRLTPHHGWNADFAVGARYYFPAVRPRSD